MAHTCERAGLRSSYLEDIIRASSFFFLPLFTRVRGRGLLGSSLPASNAQAKLITHKNSPFGGCGQDLRPLYCPTVGVGECPKRGRRGVHGVRRTESLLKWAP